MDKIHKKQQISALKEWDNVDDVFVVKIKRGIAPYAKGYTFQLLLSDNSGKTIDYKYWGGNDESKVKGIYDSIKGDSVIHVKGKVSTYNGKLQLATNEPDIIKVLNEDQYHAEDFVKPARKDIEEMYSSLKSYIKSVSNSQIKQLLKTSLFHSCNFYTTTQLPFHSKNLESYVVFLNQTIQLIYVLFLPLISI